MKKIIVLFLILSMLIFSVSCGKTDTTSNDKNANDASATTDSATGNGNATEVPENEEELIEMAKQVVLALAYGKADEADINTLYSNEEQWDLLFPDSEGPQTYYGYTFENMDDLSNKVMSLLISAETENFNITVTDASVSFYSDGNYADIFAKIPESELVNIDDLNIEKAAKVILSLSIVDGEEDTSSMDVYFVKIDGKWKVFSPTVAGFFLEAFTPTQLETSD